jgi:VWFA-related protein
MNVHVRNQFTPTDAIARSVLALLLAAGLAIAPASNSLAQQSIPPPVGAPPANAGSDPATAVKSVQEPPPPDSQNLPADRAPSIRSISDLVRIDVEVTDKSGKPVKGLPQSDFIVTEDDKAVKVSFFSYSDIEKIETAGDQDEAPVVIPLANNTPAQSEALEGQTRDRRMIVLFFDTSSMGTDELLRARDAALNFVKNTMSPADLVGVVVYANSLKVLEDFTNDRKRLAAAVNALTPGMSSQLATNDYAAATNGEADVSEYTGAAYTADDTEFNVFNTDEKLAAVQSLANVLRAIPGKKSVIQFTSGITQTGEENRTQLRAATDAANRADVSIYAVDSRGLMAEIPGGDATTGSASGSSAFTGAQVFKQMDSRQDSRDTLATLSSDTGGKTFFDLGDLGDAFKGVEADNTGYYLLGYYIGANIKRDGKWHDIKVKVKVPGAHVRFRTGYYAPKDFQHFANEDRQAQMEDAMRSESPIVDLPLAVETSMFREAGNKIYVPIDAKLASSALDWAKKHDQREAAFDFAAEVRAVPSGQEAAELHDTVRVRLDNQRYQQISQANLVYEGGVVLPPGNYRVKFIARENGSGKMGTFEQSLILPALDPAKLSLSSVLLSSQLVPAEKSAEVQTKGQGLRARMATSPLEMNGEKIVPSVTRFFTQQQTLYVFFQAYYPEKLGKSDKFDSNTLRGALIFFRNGVQVNATPLLAPSDVDAQNHTAGFRISLPLSKLDAGRYTVQAVVVAAGTQQSAFGRAYLAVQTPPAPAPTPNTPPAAPGAPATPPVSTSPATAPPAKD